MTVESHFILDLVTALGAAAAGGFLAYRCGQPILLGYLASGLIIGPSGLGVLGDITQIQALAEIGVAFLLFALGVEFSLAELNRVRQIAIQGSLLQIGLTIAVVALIAPLLGWVKNPTEGIFLGAILSLSSTAVVLKTLTERGEVNTPHGQVMLGILIAQDLALGMMLAILPALNQSGSALGMAVLWAVAKGVLFLLGALVAGIWLVPPLIKQVARTESSELFLLTVIALCLGVALITEALGLSIEMGAFIAGLMVAEIDYSHQVLTRILPLRDTFASLFFVSIGMLIDPMILIENLGIILGLVMMVMVGKALIIFPIVLRFGYSFRTAVITSLGLNQIGEFSFVLAQVALTLGIIAEKKYLLILGTTAITLVLTPVCLKLSSRFANRLIRLPLLAGYLRQFQAAKEISLPETLQNHVVVAGYGRVGQVLVRMLQNQGHSLLVIDNSEAAITQLRSQGIPYLMGDADSELVLEKAHLETAQALAIALPDPASTRLLVKRALTLAPQLDMVARAHTNNEIEVLTQLGAQEVVQPEFEAALEMGAHLLSSLGETQTTIQSVIRTIRTGRYRSVLPERVTNVGLRALLETTEGLKSLWVTLDPRSSLVRTTLADADVRQLTGATIMEIDRDHQRIHYPTGETRLHAGDRLFVVGDREELGLFEALALNQSPIRLRKSSWVPLTPTSSLVGEMLHPADLLQGQRGIIAIRHQGKLYSFLHKPLQLQPGDWLLLQTGLLQEPTVNQSDNQSGENQAEET